MNWNTIQENEVCKTVEKQTKNGRMTVNLDKGAWGTVLFPASDANTYGIAAPSEECGCLKVVGHVLLTDVAKEFNELDGSDQLICLAHGITEITGELALLREESEGTFTCGLCVACSDCGLVFEECSCKDVNAETCNCGCCLICGCNCEFNYDDFYHPEPSDETEVPIQA